MKGRRSGGGEEGRGLSVITGALTKLLWIGPQETVIQDRTYLRLALFCTHRSDIITVYEVYSDG